MHEQSLHHFCFPLSLPARSRPLKSLLVSWWKALSDRYFSDTVNLKFIEDRFNQTLFLLPLCLHWPAIPCKCRIHDSRVSYGRLAASYDFILSSMP